LIGWLVGDRNETGGGKQIENGKDGKAGERRRGGREKETNETSWCVSSEVVALEGK
jgi:hypothetical protein